MTPTVQARELKAQAAMTKLMRRLGQKPLCLTPLGKLGSLLQTANMSGMTGAADASGGGNRGFRRRRPNRGFRTRRRTRRVATSASAHFTISNPAWSTFSKQSRSSPATMSVDRFFCRLNHMPLQAHPDQLCGLLCSPQLDPPTLNRRHGRPMHTVQSRMVTVTFRGRLLRPPAQGLWTGVG